MSNRLTVVDFGQLFDRCSQRVPDPKRPGKTKKCPNRTHFGVRLDNENYHVCHACVRTLFDAFVANRRR